MKELLLLLCSYPYKEANREPLLKLLGAVQDWQKTVELINSHGIIALAAYNIKEARLENQIPEEAMSIIENGYLQSIVRNMWLTERWKEVNIILRNAGIKHVILKGMALEHTLFGSKGLRQMNDNDILVKREDALKAWFLLQQHGFSFEPIKSPLLKKIMLDLGEHLPLLYKEGYSIEIHHRLYDPKGKGGACFYNPIDDAIEIIIGDSKAWVLPHNLQLIHLLAHYEKHAMEGDLQLRLYADIVLLDNSSTLSIPDKFILNPIQGNKLEFRKATYKKRVFILPVKQRLIFIIGDIFPSLNWMKKRYKCCTIKALFHYPERTAKLFWLI